MDRAPTCTTHLLLVTVDPAVFQMALRRLASDCFQSVIESFDVAAGPERGGSRASAAGVPRDHRRGDCVVESITNTMTFISLYNDHR